VGVAAAQEDKKLFTDQSIVIHGLSITLIIMTLAEDSTVVNEADFRKKTMSDLKSPACRVVRISGG
jgi:hypothetical protein